MHHKHKEIQRSLHCATLLVMKPPLLTPLIPLVLAACGGRLSDAGAPDATTLDGGVIDAAPPDAPVVPETYRSLVDPSNWSKADLGKTLISSLGFESAVYDGSRYIYWSAINWDGGGAVLARFDTTMNLSAAAAWKQWYVPIGNIDSIVFDGHYLYLGGLGHVARYDPSAPFGDNKSLMVTSPGPDGAINFPATAAFDGRYIYFGACVNQELDCTPATLVGRYDTTSDFLATSSWELFDPKLPGGADPLVLAFPYLALTPSVPPNPSAILYDLRLPFSNVASWKSIGLPGDAALDAYSGVGFDGRYIYYVPTARTPTGALDYPNAMPDGLISRLDTQNLSNGAAWSQFQTHDVAPYAGDFRQANFDGRYLYFLGGYAYAPAPLTDNAIVERFDTTADFTSPSSWSAFDTTPLLSATDFPHWDCHASVFDGRYLYISAADKYPYILRFDAKAPKQMPPGYSGTFY